MSQRTFVIGVGMTKFEKPGAREWDYPQMALEAGTAALADAGIGYRDVGDVYASYCYGDSTSGQRAVYGLGLTGVPVTNVNNNCASGSTALFLARRAVRHGIAPCALAIGFEKMERGSLGAKYTDRAAPLERHWVLMQQRHGVGAEPFAAQLFGHAAREYLQRYSASPELFVAIAEKNHRHSANNSNSQFREPWTRDEIRASKAVFDPLTRLQCCPTSDGGAAVLVASEAFVDDHDLWNRAIEIVGQGLVTDTEASFDGSFMSIVGARMTEAATRLACEEAQLDAGDAQVVELHDCFSPNEAFGYEALGLCAAGGASALVEAGDTTYGGRWVVNPSGGLLSKGHPLGATGLAQCAELTWQLRGTAGARQVADARVGLQHNAGLGGATVVTLYAKPKA